MPSDRDGLRAADADREFVAERLRAALSEGRLTLIEYDDRLQEAYAARTYGDLKALLADLPTTVPLERSQIVPASQSATPVPVDPGHVRRWIAGVWSGWVTMSAILIVIWLASGGGDFWPAWVIGITGALLLARTVNGLMGGEPRRQAEREVRKRAEREQRRTAERERRLRDGDPIDTDKPRKDGY